MPTIADLDVRVQRLGPVMEPDGSPEQSGGILNPAAARAPGGELLLYPRCVAAKNISRVGTVRTSLDGDRFNLDRLGFALEPAMPYELRPRPGYGCEDPRVTYVAAIEAYVMSYTAYRSRRAAHRARYFDRRLSLGTFGFGALSGRRKRRRR